MKSRLSILLSLFLALSACSDADEAATPDAGPTADVATLQEFCESMAETSCSLCGETETADCLSEVRTDCSRNAMDRNPDGYSASQGSSCLVVLGSIDCDAPPLNCEGNLALLECNDYLDGQTDDVDPDCQ